MNSTDIKEVKERVLDVFEKLENRSKKVAFITGITGQDGSYLAEFLLEKGYEVHGLVRRVALEDPINRLKRIYHIKERLILHPGSIESYPRLVEIIDKIKPDECYHLASQSFVYESFEDAFTTFNTNIQGTLNILNAIKIKCPKCKFYFAGSSEIFGEVRETPQTEETPFHPRSPYGITKSTGFELTRNFRESYGIFACSGFLFNHESPRRGKEFVTRKITSAVARISAGKEEFLELGNLDTKRDWGFSGDYVKAMWLILRKETPKDYIIATGETHSVREFVEEAFKAANMPLTWEGEGANEVGKYNGKVVVKINPKFLRPAEVYMLCGNSQKARKELGWEPTVDFKSLVKMMVEVDLKIEKLNK
jgi:GDPmannose 4,6-dehydratase